ncbi:MAG TPA: GNAT family N-acetyltransferase [Polyangiaceae bacterium]|nr:GNAT family N-acetyltransferase [Polyangiaceae bacterium]
MRSAFDALELRLTLRIRRCVRRDLLNLEWFGMFTHDKQVIRRTYRQQALGKQEMLVADIGGFPVGQIWVQLPGNCAHPAGYLWALRVFPVLQGQGIGTRLLRNSERLLLARGATHAEIIVDRSNTRAKKLYESLGYRTVVVTDSLSAPARESYGPSSEQWLLSKRLLCSAP